jgi:hypothetical protein
VCILDNNRVLVYTPVIPDEFGLLGLTVYGLPVGLDIPVIPDEFGLLGLTVYGLPVGLDIPVIPDIIYLNNILFNILY